MAGPITPQRLASLFRPRSVALVGASDKSNFSAVTYRNLVDFGLGDRTHLVNRRGAETHGRPTVTSCREIGEPVDVAFMMVPQAGTLDALSDAAAAGIRNAVVLSAGYGEAGEAGRAAQAELVAHAESLDMVLLGPNQLGFANFVHRTPVTPIPGLPDASGPVALLSQSGASSSAMLDFAGIAGADLSYMVTLGNEAMVTAGHVLDYLVDDEHTRAIAIFLETVRDPGVFRAAARRAAAAGKPIVALKAGSSELAARTAAAHTGALVGDDRTVDAVFRDLGVIRVDSIEDMLITAGTAARLGRLARPGIGVVSISGGACDILADRAEDLGAELPPFAPATEQALDAMMPTYGTVHNPLDVTGAAIIDPTLFTRAIEAVSADPGVGVVAVVNSLPWASDGRPYSGQVFADAIGDGIANAAGPVVYVNQVLQPITAYTREVMARARVPHAIPGLRQAVVALRNLAWWSEATRDSATGTPQAGTPVVVSEGAPRRGAWSETAARDLLAGAGIPVVPGETATSARQAVKAATGFGGPVAMKIVSPDILHKSDIGGVRLGVAGDDAVAAAYDEITTAASNVAGARVEGVLVSPLRSGGTELLVGVVRDPDWGPVLAVALGGVFVEVLGDSALSPLPVSPARARALLESLRGAPLLHGVRGAPAADLDALGAVVARVGDLALALGNDLESLEINPLHVSGSTIEALDAVLTWRDA
ncbi:Acyl-CoA synthetase (NDP forming) [Pseudonocardia ammonioxydans]|uniref:Acyl-CoA synthetase (NDP forming) n=1 Tax=Pseudonocardia ammonioxydans TaxID=260086 RepID=A0A1I4XHX6_PSUAM|nr:acetate--CoA ligase family protein [Pseudonocardia ammonioxydans]SFN25415.1 Acyl-CoA synthetase (NDP forming) [Pseudonocardia ammonioxydans]